MRVDWHIALAWLIALVPVFASAKPVFDPMFSNGGVLQRDMPLSLSGTASPGADVDLRIAGRHLTVHTDVAGRFSATMPPVSTGTTVAITATDGDDGTVTTAIMLVGDVWLCSGQSNMEFPVRDAVRGAEEMAASADAGMRLLTIPHRNSATPETALSNLSWATAGPLTVGGFSAACYFMGKKLRSAHHVPIGLVNASWGGSNIESWIGAAAMHGLGARDADLGLLAIYARDPPVAEREIADRWQKWWHGTAPQGGSPWLDGESDGKGRWRAVPMPLRDWKTWGKTDLAGFDGLVWFRKTVTLTDAQARAAATVHLGAIDEVDQSWINSAPLGNSFGWAADRDYALPPRVLHAGANLIVVGVYSSYDKGGMFGPAAAMAIEQTDGRRIPISEGWQYLQSPPGLPPPPHAPWHAIGGLTGLYNGMIAPIGAYPFKGVAWYQGETNAGAPGDYRQLLGVLIDDWRRQFGRELPFLIVQLPNFGKTSAVPTASAWADLREAQRQAALSRPNTGLAVIIDTGDSALLHPPNKQAVGDRLYRLADHLAYGAVAPGTGPIPGHFSIEQGDLVLSFTNVERALTAESGGDIAGFELCGTDQSTCRIAIARISGDRVIVRNVGTAFQLRYCWGDAPVCGLSDGAGLPAGPFQISLK